MRSRITRACALKSDRRAELLPEPISGNADRCFHRPEQVEVGVPRSQLVSDGLDEVAPWGRATPTARDRGAEAPPAAGGDATGKPACITVASSGGVAATA